MGITIFASGKIESTSDIPHLIDDLKRVAGEHSWGYHVIDDDFDTQPDAALTHRDSGGRTAAVIKGADGGRCFLRCFPLVFHSNEPSADFTTHGDTDFIWSALRPSIV